MGRFFKRSDQLTLPGVASPRRRRRRAPGRGAWEPDRGPGFARPRLIDEQVSRRGFLSRSLGSVTAAIAAAVGVPGLAVVLAPAFRKGDQQWNPIGRVTEAAPGGPDLGVTGKPLLTSFRTLVADAYVKAAPQNVPVYVLNKGGGKFTVYDVRCTHLGCPVTWDEKTQGFYSPCHGGVFDIHGRVQAGPPPRPLDRYEVKVEGGILYAGRLFRVAPGEST